MIKDTFFNLHLYPINVLAWLIEVGFAYVCGVFGRSIEYLDWCRDLLRTTYQYIILFSPSCTQCMLLYPIRYIYTKYWVLEYNSQVILGSIFFTAKFVLWQVKANIQTLVSDSTTIKKLGVLKSLKYIMIKGLSDLFCKIGI